MKNLFLDKKKIALGILVILSVASVFFIYFKSRQGNGTVLPTPVPKTFQILRVNPPSGIDATIIPTTAIEFIFNKSINKNTILVSIEPQIGMSFEVSENNRSLFVRPLPSWEIGKTYKITISVESDEGDKISNFEYLLKLRKIIESDFNETY